MLLRTAALYDRDPLALKTAAEMLALRGVTRRVRRRPLGLARGASAPMPEKPTARRPWRTWVRAVYVILIYGGFVSAPSDKSRGGPPMGEDRARVPGLCDRLGGHLGVPAQLHNRDGLGLRQ